MSETYLFCWDNVPGSDNERLVGLFLIDDLHIDWAERAEIYKSNDGRTIFIFMDGNSVEIMINPDEGKATLKTSDGRTRNLTVKKERGKLNIYFENRSEYTGFEMPERKILGPRPITGIQGLEPLPVTFPGRSQM